MIYRKMGTTLPSLNPVLTPLYPPNKVNSSKGYLHIFPTSHVTYYQEINMYTFIHLYIHTVIYREMGTFLRILTPVSTPLCPQNKVNFDDISKSVTFTSFLPLI